MILSAFLTPSWKDSNFIRERHLNLINTILTRPSFDGSPLHVSLCVPALFYTPIATEEDSLVAVQTFGPCIGVGMNFEVGVLYFYAHLEHYSMSCQCRIVHCVETIASIAPARGLEDSKLSRSEDRKKWGCYSTPSTTGSYAYALYFLFVILLLMYRVYYCNAHFL